MDQLARDRADACLQALIKKGVDPNRLWITAKGRAGEVKVDFFPKAYAPHHCCCAHSLRANRGCCRL